MFLGIPYDKWHLVLAIIAVFFSFYLLWIGIADFLIPNLGLWLTALVVYLFSIQIAHHLQCWNEIQQALDPEAEEKYGLGISPFQKNSRDDFRWFWYGISVSWILPLVIILM